MALRSENFWWILIAASERIDSFVRRWYLSVELFQMSHESPIMRPQRMTCAIIYLKVEFAPVQSGELTSMNDRRDADAISANFRRCCLLHDLDATNKQRPIPSSAIRSKSHRVSPVN